MDLTLMCSTNRTAAVFTATSQESPLLGTDPSGLWQVFSSFFGFSWLRTPLQLLDTAVHKPIERFFYTLLLRRRNGKTVRPRGNKNNFKIFSGRKLTKSLYTIIEKVWLFNPASEACRYAALFLRKLPQTISVYYLCHTFMEEFIKTIN